MTLATSHFDLCDDVGGRTGVIDDDDLGGDLDDASLCRRRPSSRSALLPFHQHRHKYMPNRAIRLLRAFGDHRSSWSFMAIAPMFFAQRLPSMAAAAAATRTSIPGGRASPRGPTICFRIIASHISSLSIYKDCIILFQLHVPCSTI